jgi:predicted PurR-regulated permease PerM
MGVPSRDETEGTSHRLDRAAVPLTLLAVLAVAATITYLGPILKPLLVAVFVYFATRPAAEALTRHRWPPWLAYLTLFIAALGAASLVTLFVYGEALDFRDHWTAYQERLLALIGHRVGEQARSLREMFRISSKEVFTFVFGRTVGVAELLVMTFFYLLFIILGANSLSARVKRAFPGELGDRLLKVGQEIGQGIEQFIKVKTLVSLGLGASSAVLMYAFGLSHSLLWGFLFFALNYITYIGSIAACVPPIALAYLDLDNPLLATILGGLIVVNRFVWIDYLEVKMAGKRLNIDSILLFVWLAYWGWVWGALGLILAFPMIASLKIVLEHIESTRGWAVLMSEE